MTSFDASDLVPGASRIRAGFNVAQTIERSPKHAGLGHHWAYEAQVARIDPDGLRGGDSAGGGDGDPNRERASALGDACAAKVRSQGLRCRDFAVPAIIPRKPLPMTPLRRSLLAALACCLVGGQHRAALLPTVPHVDLARYAGTWHEIARLPNVFQASCACSHARYEPRSDGSLTVVNSCVTRRGRNRQVVGRAEPVPCSGNARLRVRFGGFAALVPVAREGNYWIIALDDDYQWAMVGTSVRRFLWILARDTCLPPKVYAGLVQRARCLGFDVDQLVTR